MKIYEGNISNTLIFFVKIFDNMHIKHQGILDKKYKGF